MMRFAVAGAVLALFSALASGQAPDLTKLDLVLKSVPDGPVAKVNGVNIDKKDFVALYNTELGMLAMQTRQKPTDAQRLKTGLQCVNVLVQREILRQEAARRNITVTNEELQRSWQGNMDLMRKAMAKDGAAAALTEEQILARSGADKKTAMAELRESMLIEKVRQQLAKDKGIGVSDAELKGIYDDNKQAMKRPEGAHFLRIYVNTRGMDDAKKAAARAKADNALSRIKAGESFQTVAKAVTDAPDKEKGGDPGMVQMSALPPSYVKQLSLMKPGETSAVFEDELGFHIVKLVELSKGGEVTYEQAQPMIKAQVLNEKLENVVREFCGPIVNKPGCVQVYLQLDTILATHPDGGKLRKEVFEGIPMKPGVEKTAAPAASKPAAKPAAKAAAPKAASKPAAKAAAPKPKAKPAAKKK